MRAGTKIGVNCWIKLEQLAEISLVMRKLGSNSVKPGTLVTSLIDAVLPAITAHLSIRRITNISEALAILQQEGIQSVQISSGIKKALAEEAAPDADFKNWRQARLELEQLLEQHLEALDLEANDGKAKKL